MIRHPPRLVYAVHHSITNGSDGYAVRGHGIAKALKEKGVKLWVLTSSAYFDFKLPFRVDVDGVTYLHLDSNQPVAYHEFLQMLKPDAVLAASNWLHAKPIQAAARTHDLPFYYEARGFWELSKCARDPNYASSPNFRKAVAGEVAIAQASDHVFTLNRHMAAEWSRRGVSSSNISLMPNGLDHIHNDMTGPNLRLLGQLGLAGSKVIAYVGSFSVYEGLDDLIRAFALARQHGLEAKLLLLGSLTRSGNSSLPCERLGELSDLVLELELANQVVFGKRVAPEVLPSYFSFVDLMVVPRKPELVCELVSPLKPMEAVANGTRLLLSSVAPLADLKSLGPGVHYFEKGSVDHLARKLLEVLSKPTPARCPKSLYPGLEEFLWSRSVQSLLDKLNEAPHRLKSSFSWSTNA